MNRDLNLEIRPFSSETMVARNQSNGSRVAFDIVMHNNQKILEEKMGINSGTGQVFNDLYMVSNSLKTAPFKMREANTDCINPFI